MKKIRVACSWCGEPKDGLGPIMPWDAVSHGICKPCLKKAERELDE